MIIIIMIIIIIIIIIIWENACQIKLLFWRILRSVNESQSKTSEIT